MKFILKSTALLIIIVFALTSCSHAADDTSVSESSVYEQASETVSNDISLPETSEISYTPEESNAPVAEELGMTDEMWVIWLSDNYYDSGYNYFAKPYGMLNGYLFLEISRESKRGDTTNLVTSYLAGGFDFDGLPCGRSEIGKFLYKDKTFLTFEEAYEAGLFDAAEARELMKTSDYPREEKFWMSEEMWQQWFDENGKEAHCNYFYCVTGRLNCGLLFELYKLRDDHLYSSSAQRSNEYDTGSICFVGVQCGKSKIGKYIYKDGEFITFEEAYEAGLFDAEEAYALFEKTHRDTVYTVAVKK